MVRGEGGEALEEVGLTPQPLLVSTTSTRPRSALRLTGSGHERTTNWVS